MVTQIIITNINKIRTQKSQASQFSNPEFIQYNIQSGDIDKMLNIKAFVNASTSELEDIMDCHVNRNT